jgi:hypothetical protein
MAGCPRASAISGSLDLLLNAAPWIGGSRSHEDKHLSALINAVEHVERSDLQ